MKHKTQGIVLSYIKYQEHSIIARIYTASLGLQSYLVRGLRRSGNKYMQIGYFYPLVPLEIVAYHKPLREIQHLREVRMLGVYKSLPFVPEKQPYVSLFCGLLQHLMAPYDEPHTPDACFSFVLRSCYAFDRVEKNYPLFGLQFLAKLSYYVGIGVQKESLKAYATAQHDPPTSARLAAHIMEAYHSPYSPKQPKVTPWAIEGLQLLLKYYEKQWLIEHNYRLRLSPDPLLITNTP